MYIIDTVLLVIATGIYTYTEYTVNQFPVKLNLCSIMVDHVEALLIFDTAFLTHSEDLPYLC